jgi:cytochrome c-type biogenesis protein CcmH
MAGAQALQAKGALMGWVMMLAIAAVTGAGLWWALRPDKAVTQFLAAALLLALSGYALQGRPDQEGRPKRPPERQAIPESAFAQTRENMLGRFDRAWYWLNMSDGLARSGNTQGAAQVIVSGLRESPRDPDLWVGLGNALVVHGEGLMSPAAQLAFQRAAALAPDHPGPRFFYGLALAQGGNFDEAERIWRALLAEAPADAEYRRTIEERLATLAQARAAGTVPPPAQAPAPAPAPAPVP